ncbi:MAG: hypothetical protein A2599_03640 [Candidatus Staskawiczbacteria bacterium RIFOXYD1_FULL_39_28]|nr:MAG: hypothetical protein A2599_03640 [Candidatus Staskawiczbacteria bacterium RIFOXYD1_FULL_39_28]
MVKGLFKNYIYPIAVFGGGMIGVGFLSLPYIASKAGIWVMLTYFLVITALVVTIDLIFAEISLKTPDFKRFPGFVGHYLGRYAQTFAMLSTIFALLGILLVYLIVGGNFLTSALSPFLGGNILAYTIIYFLIASSVVYFDIKVIAKVEFWVLILLVFLLFFILLQGIPQFKMSHIFFSNFKFQISNLFLPYGALLFSLWGIGLIPQAEEMLLGRKHNLKKIIIFSTISVSAFYLLFIFLILGISGTATTQTAIDGLANFFGRGVVAVALLAGTLATLTAFIAQGTILKKVLAYDLKIKHWQAFIMTCFTPLILLLLGLKAFLPIISFVGGVLLGIDGILILLMYKKIGGKNIIVYPLSLVFLFGIIYEIFYSIK